MFQLRFCTSNVSAKLFGIQILMLENTCERIVNLHEVVLVPPRPDWRKQGQTRQQPREGSIQTTAVCQDGRGILVRALDGGTRRGRKMTERRSAAPPP